MADSAIDENVVETELVNQPTQDVDSTRVRTMTEKGFEMYTDTCTHYVKRIEGVWNIIVDIFIQIESASSDLSLLRALERRLIDNYEKYVAISDEYVSFLKRTNTQQSLSDSEYYVVKYDKNKVGVQKVLTEIKDLKSQALETFSVSKHSSRSVNSVSSVLKQRAKADAQRARVEFAKKETSLRKKQALLDQKKAENEADLYLLAQEKEAAAAEAEARALESLSSESVSHQSVSEKPVDPMERTKQYVNEQNSLRENFHEQSVMLVSGPHDNISNHTPLPRQPLDAYPTPLNTRNLQFDVAHNASHNQSHIVNSLDVVHGSTAELNASAPTFTPRVQTVTQGLPQEAPHPQTGVSQSVVSDFTRFLLKKDLLLSRLSRFNDRPESYATWKASFTRIMTELQVTSYEELDLLVKWLGNESSKHALSIRESNVHDPVKGLRRVWARLEERYGCPEMVESALKYKITNFPKLTNRDHKKLYELSDIVSEIESVKEDPKYTCLLAYYDSSAGVLPIINKLPYGIQEKWTTRAISYKKRNNVPFPPFTVLADFLRDISKTKNDPGFMYETGTAPTAKGSRTSSRANQSIVSTRKSDVVQKSVKPEVDVDKVCPLHKVNHNLNKCRSFKSKSLEERKAILRDNNICFRCCLSTKHMARSCKEKVKCLDCGSERHATAMHISKVESKPMPSKVHGGEQDIDAASTGPVSTEPKKIGSSCTQVCGNNFNGKSCAKIMLVNVYPKEYPGDRVKMYAMLDDQSNRSLVRPDFFELFEDSASAPIPYTLSSCAGVVETSGRRASGYVVESFDGNTSLTLPTLIECENIPNNREEIPTPNVAEHYSHLTNIADSIPALDNNASILILIGRDLIESHHVLEQRIGPRNTPFAQRLPLGWVIVGETCLGKTHHPYPDVIVNKVYLHPDDGTSIFEPCPNNMNVKEKYANDSGHALNYVAGNCDDLKSVFERTRNDDKVGMSVQDREFLKIMNESFVRDEDGNWVAPLPFRSNRPRLPNNRDQAVKRANILHNSLQKNPTKREHFFTFMKKIFDNNHAEVAPTLKAGQECWYLPIFGVYHPRKPDQIRGVFDSSAQFNNVSLNNVLLTGPDLTNSLLGILIRFRKHPVAITADVEQMFYCFKVRKDHRDMLRFLWYRDNDFSNDLIEYRMCAHVFGNSPSPAIATYGLRTAAVNSESAYGTDVKEFVERNFYVDDGLVSFPTVSEAVDLLKRTQEALRVHGNIRLHKIASNNSEVMNSFSSDDLAKDFRNIDLSVDELPLQRSLGLSWDLQSDSFTFQVSSEQKPFTRRGILSTINSIYDPLGFVSPIIVQGKLLLKDLMSATKDWDQPLPPDREKEWSDWRNSLHELERLQVPRTYTSMALSEDVRKEIHIFCDASEKAIAAVAFLKVTESSDESVVGFIMGKVKLAPSHGHTIPRLELCSAVLAVQIAETVGEHLDMPVDSVQYYTDSKVVLGYINNETRRFYTYVSNRVEIIRRYSKPEQWRYIISQMNPADCGTRPFSTGKLKDSGWLLGPRCLFHKEEEPMEDSFELVNPDDDKELRTCVDVKKTSSLESSNLGSHRFERFSSWTRLVNALALLRLCVKDRKLRKRDTLNLDCFQSMERFVVLQVQQETYFRELTALRNSQPLPRDSTILDLNPFVDSKGLLRVGGRLNESNLHEREKNPLILPGKHHVSLLLVRHYHETVQHQGRHFSEGAVRTAGYWIVGCKRLVSSVIHKCVKCRQLRRKQEYQKMADLPSDRLEPGPPFTYVGVDTFGPWNVVSRRTRGGQANSKRWAILFSCLTTRSVHIEVVDEMSTSSFINALRRFVALRGDVKQFRSDRGTNFIGSTDKLKIDAINVEDNTFKQFLFGKGTTWVFNPPHASHMGGAWERMIGIARRILESLLQDVSSRNLTNDVLVTFMAEVCAIMNSRPIVPVSTDSENPLVLSPSILLTQKVDGSSGSFGDFDVKDLYRAEWKRVQALADMFWNRWRKEFLHTLQNRRKWQDDRPNVKNGDFVLLSDKNAQRSDWSKGVIVNAIASKDGKVRKAEVRVIREGKVFTYTRPITEIVLLCGD